MRGNPDLVSVIIPARNVAETIEAQLYALKEQTFNGEWEVIVADNGSTDGTQEIVKSWRSRLPDLSLIDASVRKGAAYARNTGAKSANGDLLVFCDADDVAHPRWLTNLVKATRYHNVVGGSFDIMELNDSEIALWAWEGGIARSRDYGLPLAHGFLSFALSGNLAIWRDVFDSLGGFPVAPGVGEDVAFSWTLQFAGYTLGHAPDAVMYCRFRNSIPGVMRQHFGYGKASARIYRKYRHHGASKHSLGRSVRFWFGHLRLLLRLKCLLQSRAARGWWAKRLAFDAGCLIGSIRYRVIFLG